MQPREKSVRGQGLLVFAWLLAWLILIDLAVNIALGPNSDRVHAPGLKRYFEYGRSIEGKLARKLAQDSSKGGNILSAGWIDLEQMKQLPDRPHEGADLLVAAYGQSFTLNAVSAAAKLDKRFTIRPFGGPGAPPSHSYAAYTADAPSRKADVVVFGVLSSTIGQMGSLSGLFSNFESPAPFTYPRYRLTGDRLTAELPFIRSEAEFRAAFMHRSGTWQQFKAQLEQSDRGYDAFTFEESAADSSSIVRLARRGWVAHQQAYDAGVYVAGEGFNPQAEEVKVLKAMVVELAQQTRSRGERLIVLLLHARGHADHLHTALQGTLLQSKIEYVSTHTQFSANDPGNFLRDGHYTDAANNRFAAAVLSKLRGMAAISSTP